MEYDYIINRLSENPKYPVARSGKSSLSELAQEIKNELMNPENYVSIKQAFISLLDEFIIESADNARLYCDLVRLSSFPIDDIGRFIKITIAEKFSDQNFLKQKVEFIRLLADSNFALIPKELELETEFFSKYPWVWFDCMLRTDIYRASADIINFIDSMDSNMQVENIHELIWRLPIVTKYLKSESSAWGSQLTDVIKNSYYKNEIIKWFEDRNYMITQLSKDIPEPTESAEIFLKNTFCLNTIDSGIAFL